MQFEIRSKKDFLSGMSDIFSNDLGWSETTFNICRPKVNQFFADLREDITVGIEYPYVDKVYRNSYYHYYSSKLDDYSRHCIRISFFLKELLVSDFYNPKKEQDIQENFLGFLVIRPTVPAVIGRNILRPDIFKKTDQHYVACTNGYAAVNGLKLQVAGFPHSSQDMEMMVCAETTIWSILEFFSHKYPDYRPVLPNEINKVLSSTSIERQIPSGGLSALQISYALKEFGFGVKTYTVPENEEVRKGEFSSLDIIKKTIIPIYVESGIPVVTTVGNKNEDGHVFAIVGRTAFSSNNTKTVKKVLKNKESLYDYYEQPAEYLVIDDNLTPYSKINLDNPTSNYPNYTAFIDGVIVPLHSKIYMEAAKVYQLGFDWIYQLSSIIKFPSLILRTFLTSSRSYKHYVAQNPDFDDHLKSILISMNAPKFLWIIELSTQELVPDRACGMILVDATEPKKFNVLGTFINNYYITSGEPNFKAYRVALQPFNVFHNLKPF